jgi:hypothetical protein
VYLDEIVLEHVEQREHSLLGEQGMFQKQQYRIEYQLHSVALILDKGITQVRVDEC